MHFVLRSTRVLSNGIIAPADIVIHNDYIAAIHPYRTINSGHDLGDLLIVPGFVDLHSDSIEKEIEPRPGASFPIHSSIIELDKKLTMSGITTIFHAVAFNDESLSKNRATETAAAIIRQISSDNQTLLGADNLIHARYELTSFNSVSTIKELIAENRVQLLSITDHTPGQGQFQSIAKWKQFHLPVYDLSDHEADTLIIQKQKDKYKSHDILQDLLDFV